LVFAYKIYFLLTLVVISFRNPATIDILNRSSIAPISEPISARFA